MVEQQKEGSAYNYDELQKAVTNGDRTLLFSWIDCLTEEECNTLFCKEKRGKLLRTASQYNASMIWHILSTEKFSGD